MRLPRTPAALRHIPAVVAFWSIALATVDPRLGSPVLGLAAAGVGIGLLLRRPFARPMGAGLAASWLLFLAFGGHDSLTQRLPEWSSVAWGCAGLAGLALATLAFAPSARRYGARGALACAALGLLAGTAEWAAYDELWVGSEHLGAAAALALAGALAIKRPREAASLVVALGVVQVVRPGLPALPFAVVVGGGWWLSEHGLRAVEGRPPAVSRFERPGRWLGAAALVVAMGALVLTTIEVAEHRSLHALDLGFLAALLATYAALALGLLRGARWAAPLTVGLGFAALLRGGWLDELHEAALIAPLVVLAPSIARLESRRGLALAGLGLALGGATLYAFVRNSWGDPGDLGLALAGLAAVIVAVVGVARGRTWGVLAALGAAGLLYVSGQAVSGVSAFDRPTGCLIFRPFPGFVALLGLYLAGAAYAGPLVRALRPEGRVS